MFCGTELDLEHKYLFCYHGYLYFGYSTLEKKIDWHSHIIIRHFQSLCQLFDYRAFQYPFHFKPTAIVT